MPFTPYHMGPGILIKSILRGSFSLMVFGWAQIVMDLQPLVAILTGEGKWHGWTHTFLAALVLGAASAVTGGWTGSVFGVSDPAQATAAPLHSPNFNPDERAIPLGMRILSHLLLDALNTQSALAAGTPGF